MGPNGAGTGPSDRTVDDFKPNKAVAAKTSRHEQLIAVGRESGMYLLARYVTSVTY